MPSKSCFLVILCIFVQLCRCFRYYKSFLENYLLHGRVRMKMEQMLYGKLLRSYDKQYTTPTNHEDMHSEDSAKTTQV